MMFLISAGNWRKGKILRFGKGFEGFGALVFCFAEALMCVGLCGGEVKGCEPLLVGSHSRRILRRRRRRVQRGSS